MKRLFKKLRSRANSSSLRKRGQRRYRTLSGIESLEGRRLMAVDFFQSLSSNSPSYVSQQPTVATAPPLDQSAVDHAIAATPVFALLPGSQVRTHFDAGDGILRVVGTDRSDQLRVVDTDGRLSVQTYVRGLTTTGQGVWSTLDIQTRGGFVPSLDAVSVKNVEMYGWGGHDNLKYMHVVSDHANPWLLSSNSSFARAIRDQTFEVEMFGGEGNDTLEVLAGAKAVLDGGAGRDHLIGSWGDDHLTGGSGNDSLYGNDGNDRLVGGAGVNTIEDGLGDDTINFILNDVPLLFATQGGNDTVTGTVFHDVIIGSDGNDTLLGYAGNDMLFGNAGNDTLVGGAGINTIDDGLGDDTIDFSANDFPVVFATFGGNDTVVGSAYDDILTGSYGNDSLSGNAGNDQLYGLDGNDTLLGGADNDELYGLEDHDTLDGGADNDWLEAGSAGETIVASAGMDYNAHQWVVDGTTCSDVRQTLAETCVFLSSLASAASVGMDLASRITYLGNFTFQVQLFNWDTEDVHYENVTFDGTVIAGDPASIGGEYWTVLYQRAYLQMMARISENFRQPEYAMFALTGRGVEDGDSPSDIAEALYHGRIVTAEAADDGGPVYEKHAYTVLDAYYQNDEWFVRLRNPWGRDVKDADSHPFRRSQRRHYRNDLGPVLG